MVCVTGRGTQGRELRIGPGSGSLQRAMDRRSATHRGRAGPTLRGPCRASGRQPDDEIRPSTGIPIDLYESVYESGGWLPALARVGRARGASSPGGTAEYLV